MSGTVALLRGTNAHRDPAPRFGERNPIAAERFGDGLESDADILYEARTRFRRVIDWEGGFRAAFVDDVKFANGDADNHWQWPLGLFNERDGANEPALTINKTRQHCLQVVNDAKKNKPQVRITPVSDEATKEAADVFEGIVRHIEYLSDATTAYDTATEHQVQGGIGWWRVVTEYEADDGFELGIRIRRVRDALSVYIDPDAQEADKSDARWAFVADDVPREEFDARYPEYRDRVPQGTLGPLLEGGWLDEDHVRVAEYYRRVETLDVLHLLADGSTVREGEIGSDDALGDLRGMSVRSRELRTERIEWLKIVGGEIVDSRDWPGRYIPLIPVIGEEAVIEGRLERKGHVRALKDPQRMYNYWSSGGVTSVALQSKVPYIAAAESIEAYQRYWDTANTVNHSVLPYNARDDQGQPLPAPQRQEPPQMSQAYIQGMQIAQNEMMMASGQYQPTMGQDDPRETSGRAIIARQRQGDTATYHYIDNLATAIRFTGRILIDLIPKVYDTPRVLRIMAMDGTVDSVRLDPAQPQALQQQPNPQQPPMGPTPPTPQQQMASAVTRIFNPNVGRYEVQADVGASYATRREQAFEAFTQVIATAPNLMNVAGDLLFKAADFPMAEELAERLQRLVPPQALGQGAPPEVLQLQQQLQGAQAHVALLGERLAVAEMKLKGRDEQKDIDAYEAVTQRMNTLLNQQHTDSVSVAPNELRALIGTLVRDALAQPGMAPVSQQAMADINRQNVAMMGQGPPQPTGPGGNPLTPPGLASGQLAALSPVRPPIIRPPGQAPFRGVSAPMGGPR